MTSLILHFAFLFLIYHFSSAQTTITRWRGCDNIETMQNQTSKIKYQNCGIPMSRDDFLNFGFWILHFDFLIKMLQFYLAAAQFAVGDLPAPTTPSAKLTPAILVQEQLGWRLGLMPPAPASPDASRGGGPTSQMAAANLTLFETIDNKKIKNENVKCKMKDVIPTPRDSTVLIFDF
jgi:hypothetical protein